MDQQTTASTKRVADLLKALAYLSLALFFLNALIGFVNDMRFDFSFGGFLSASWSFVKNLFWMGATYLLLLAASHALTLLLGIADNTKKLKTAETESNEYANQNR